MFSLIRPTALSEYCETYKCADIYGIVSTSICRAHPALLLLCTTKRLSELFRLRFRLKLRRSIASFLSQDSGAQSWSIESTVQKQLLQVPRADTAGLLECLEQNVKDPEPDIGRY